MRLPLAGAAGKNWTIANHFDCDQATGGIRDYTGRTGSEALTYDGHGGIDFELASFRAMDLGIAALAAAEGTVEETFDLSYDRNRTCSQDKWNFVKLRHANGFATLYAHLRQNSVTVRVGDRVTAGTRLGLIGSSGCSTFPHVHLEVLDCRGRALDAMAEGLLESPPPYPRDAQPAVMETRLFQPAINDIASVEEPGAAESEQIASGSYFSVGVIIAYLKPGDLLRIEMISPDNAPLANAFEQRVTSFHSRTSWWANFMVERSGRWLARILINGRVADERPVLVMGNR